MPRRRVPSRSPGSRYTLQPVDDPRPSRVSESSTTISVRHRRHHRCQAARGHHRRVGADLGGDHVDCPVDHPGVPVESPDWIAVTVFRPIARGGATSSTGGERCAPRGRSSRPRDQGRSSPQVVTGWTDHVHRGRRAEVDHHHGAPYRSMAATALTTLSAPTSRGLSVVDGEPGAYPGSDHDHRPGNEIGGGNLHRCCRRRDDARHRGSLQRQFARSEQALEREAGTRRQCAR